MYFMGSPLLKLVCVVVTSVGKRAARPVTTRRLSVLACLFGAVYLPGCLDAHGDVRSGLPGDAVGGVFSVHGCSVSFAGGFINHNKF